MKYFIKFFILSFVISLAACNKADKLPSYQNGTAPSLNASLLKIAPAVVDSNKVALTLNWSSPAYATDSSRVKYIIQIDESGNNFKNPTEFVVNGSLSRDFTAKELNQMLLARGYAFNTAHDMDVRIISSYANNNDVKVSNTLKLNMTPYKIPPKIPVPANLYLVGDVNGWNNSASLDKRFYFYQTGETTFEGVFNFPSGGNYKLIQQLGNWDTQYRMVAGGTSAAGQFKQENSDPAFPAPSDAGSYRIVVDFQNATYTVTKTDAVRAVAPANLYLVGDVNGWNNSGSLDPKYKFTKVGDFVFTLTADFTAGGGYKLIQVLGDWNSQFRAIAGGTAFAGEFKQENSDPTFPNPTPAGTYKITVNFATMTYSVVKV
ncbi:hypothetical protein BH09BAC2_BH09BAC2_05720 [soil metagenome]